jgi:hypothetical protein
MSDRARRKERQRLKREKKKLAQRRAQSVSPYKRIGSQGEVEACYINSDWDEEGLASLYVVRQNPQGGHALATFHIDTWCVGLKDAWGFLDLGQDELDKHFDRTREHFDLTRIDLETARRFVAAGIRFARQNGFRLPPHYDRWVNLLGGAGDVEHADLSGFGKDGKLCWVGSVDDLRQRLIGSSVEDFLARSDVEYMMEVPESFFDEEDESDQDEEDSDDGLLDDDAAEELFDRVAISYADGVESMTNEMASRIRQRLISRGQAPPDNLEETVCSYFAADLARSIEEDAAANEVMEDDDEAAGELQFSMEARTR